MKSLKLNSLSQRATFSSPAILLMAIGLLMLAGCSRSEHGQTSEAGDAVATVGTNQIGTQEFLAELSRQSFADKSLALGAVIRRELLFAEAQRSGFERSPEMVEAWKNLLISRFAEKQQERLGELPVPTAAELTNYYQEHADRYGVRERVHVAMIQLRQNTTADRAPDDLLARAAALRAQAIAAAHESPDFGILARDNSDLRSSRYNGGDVGWITSSAVHLSWPPEVTQAMFTLREPGEISPIIKTSDGLYLLKLIERQESRTLPFEQVRERLEFQMARERCDEFETNFYAELRSHFPVTINTQRVDEISRKMHAANTQPPRMPAN